MVLFCWNSFIRNDCYDHEDDGGVTKKSNDIVFWNEEVKSGTEGLFDCGFEYRIVASDRPNCYETSVPSSANEEKKDENNFCCDYTNELYHISSNTKVSNSNWKQYLLPNNNYNLYNRIVKCCQEMTQQRIQNEFDMSFLPIPSRDNRLSLNLLVSNNLLPYNNTGMEEQQSSNPILLILPGKGESRAGILSTRHLTQSSMEAGSCVHHIKEAQKRGYSIIIVDSNAHGKYMKAQCLVESLHFISNSLLSNNGFDDASKQKYEQQRKLYILAHSASGGHFVRYLMNNDNRNENRTGENRKSSSFLVVENIESVVFTDSTHNIQWLHNKQNNNCENANDRLSQFFQSKKCLYIKNNSEHPSETFANHRNKPSGSSFYSCGTEDKENSHVHYTSAELHHKRRFGTIPTVWAGTTDHSAMCWVARDVIWQFFDSILNQ